MRSIHLIVLYLCSIPLVAEAVHAADMGLGIGRPAPLFELKDLSGEKVRLLERRGTVILLNFWSTLCAPCVEEMDSLNRLHASLDSSDFEVIAVAIDSSDKPVGELALKKKLAFTILLDMEKEVFFDLYAGPMLPASYLIDRTGIIVEKFSGARVWDSHEIKNKILKLIEKR